MIAFRDTLANHGFVGIAGYKGSCLGRQVSDNVHIMSAGCPEWTGTMVHAKHKVGRLLRSRRGMFVGLLGLSALLFVLSLASPALMDPDEGRYALVTQHMIHTGQWLVPQLDGKPYFNKPAPYFWLAALCQWCTGSIELGGRLISALAAAGVVCLCADLARRLAGWRGGWLAGCIVATSGMLFVMARIYRMDMAFTLCLWASVWWLAVHEHPRDATHPPQRRWRWVGFYALAAAATLMKGPVGFVLPCLIAAAYLLLSGRPGRIREMFNLPGLAVLLGLTLPWYLAVAWKEPGFIEEFIVRQHLARFASEDFRESHFTGLLALPMVLVGLFPWSTYLFGTAWRERVRRHRRTRRPRTLLLWLAVLIPLGLFCLSRGNLPHYVLPVLPPLAVLVSLPVSRWLRRNRRDRLYDLGAGLMSTNLAVLATIFLGIEAYLGTLDAWSLLPVVLVLFAGPAIVLAVLRRRRATAIFAAVTTATAIYAFASLHTFGPLFEQRSARSLALSARDRIPPDAHFRFIYRERYSFVVYAGGYSNSVVSLDAPSRADQKRKLARAMQDHPRVCVLVTSPLAMLRIQSSCDGRVETLADQDGHYVVVPSKRRPEPVQPKGNSVAMGPAVKR